MNNRFLSGIVSAALLLPCIAAAAEPTFEPDGTLERKAFEYVKVNPAKITVTEDAEGDLTIFDRNGEKRVPPLLADLKKVSYEATESGWKVTFETVGPLPEDPGMAVNFFVYADSDGNEKNNAKNGVYRSGSDATYMILFGTRTKWHASRWIYDSATGKWNEQPSKPNFTYDRQTFTLTIPFSELPEEKGLKMRAFSLTSHEGVTAVDVAPGEGLPPVLQNQGEPSGEGDSSTTFSTVFLTVAIVLLAVSIHRWKKSSRRR